MTQTIPTYTIPTPAWVSVETAEDRGPNAGFQMYTRQGNDAVAMVVRTTIEAAVYCSLTRDETLHLLRDLLNRVGFVHPEWHDSEPRGEIRDQISRGFVDVLGYVALSEDESL
jgi:hypothetical protein